MPNKEWAYELNKKYVIRKMEVSNQLIVQLSEFQNGFSVRKIKKTDPAMCLQYDS
jgi:hypothetical protein